MTDDDGWWRMMTDDDGKLSTAARANNFQANKISKYKYFNTKAKKEAVQSLQILHNYVFLGFVKKFSVQKYNY